LKGGEVASTIFSGESGNWEQLFFKKQKLDFIKIKEEHLKAQEILRRCSKTTRMVLDDITP